MSNGQSLAQEKIKTRSYLFDSLAVLLVFFIPALVHLIKFPLYLLDPMKVIIVLALVHTTSKNTWFLALFLPLVSFVFSDHPALLKSILISIELVLTIWLFYFFKSRKLNSFFSMFLALLFSKLFYYAFKFLLIKTGLLNSDLFTTPFIFQLIVGLVMPAYLFLFTEIIKPNRNPNPS